MKEWMCWILLVAGVLAICFIGWWLTSILSVMTCLYITIVINGVVMCYNMMEFGGKKKQNLSDKFDKRTEIGDDLVVQQILTFYYNQN